MNIKEKNQKTQEDTEDYFKETKTGNVRLNFHLTSVQQLNFKERLNKE